MWLLTAGFAACRCGPRFVVTRPKWKMLYNESFVSACAIRSSIGKFRRFHTRDDKFLFHTHGPEELIGSEINFFTSKKIWKTQHTILCTISHDRRFEHIFSIFKHQFSCEIKYFPFLPIQFTAIFCFLGIWMFHDRSVDGSLCLL